MRNHTDTHQTIHVQKLLGELISAAESLSLRASLYFVHILKLFFAERITFGPIQLSFPRDQQRGNIDVIPDSRLAVVTVCLFVIHLNTGFMKIHCCIILIFSHIFHVCLQCVCLLSDAKMQSIDQESFIPLDFNLPGQRLIVFFFHHYFLEGYVYVHFIYQNASMRQLPEIKQHREVSLVLVLFCKVEKLSTAPHKPPVPKMVHSHPFWFVDRRIPCVL